MSSPRLLYVEDEPSLAKIVVDTLQAKQFVVQHEQDGSKVIDSCIQFQPDLCILDVMLPRRDGFSIGKEMAERFPQIPILYLTARTQTEDVLKGFAHGGNDYLKKPFSLEELLVRIHNLLQLTQNRQAATSPADGVQLGSYRFYPDKHELHFSDQQRNLSHREVQLLKAFAQHQNGTLHRRDLLRDIWGDDSYYNSRNLDVYITKLRGYLQHDPSLKIITLKGVGYHFSVG